MAATSDSIVIRDAIKELTKEIREIKESINLIEQHLNPENHIKVTQRFDE